jgi:hypothetical protein
MIHESKYKNFTTINTSEDGYRLLLFGVIVATLIFFAPIISKQINN